MRKTRGRAPSTGCSKSWHVPGPCIFSGLSLPTVRPGLGGISSRVLTERPRGLEQKGIVYREYEPTIPPAVTYGITKRMKEIKQVL
jgi:hypothetical protein